MEILVRYLHCYASAFSFCVTACSKTFVFSICLVYRYLPGLKHKHASIPARSTTRKGLRNETMNGARTIAIVEINNQKTRRRRSTYCCPCGVVGLYTTITLLRARLLSSAFFLILLLLGPYLPSAFLVFTYRLPFFYFSAS